MFNIKKLIEIMRKTIFAVLSLVFMTSCIGAMKKKINETLGTDSVANADVNSASGNERAQAENFEDLPLYVSGIRGSSVWYVPLGYQPKQLFTDEEYNALSEKQCKEDQMRQDKENDAFVNMLKKNKERYVTVLFDNRKIPVKYVSSNFDKGSANVFISGGDSKFRDENMKFLRFTNGDNHDNTEWSHGLLVTEKFLNTHKLLDYKNIYGSDGENGMKKEMFESAKMNIERQTGKKVKTVRLNCKIDGGKYCFYTILFENKDNKAFAMQVVTTPEGVVMGEMEDTQIDEDGNAEWAVDMDGEYPSIDIIMAEENNGTLKLWFLDMAPEHIECGTFTVKGNKLLKRTYYSYYLWMP